MHEDGQGKYEVSTFFTFLSLVGEGGAGAGGGSGGSVCGSQAAGRTQAGEAQRTKYDSPVITVTLTDPAVMVFICMMS